MTPPAAPLLSAAQVRAFTDAHRTVCRYRPDPLPQEHLDTILYAAQRAPTDATAQMYSLIRLTDPGVRERVVELTGNAHMGSAPEVFVVCLDVHRLRLFLTHHGHQPGEWPAIAVHFGVGDAVLAGQSLLLAAELLGYQGCWVGGVLNRLEELVELLELPAGVLPFAGLTLGLPDEQPAQRPRLDRSLVLHENRYREPGIAELEGAGRDMAAISARGDWAQTLARYFAVGGTMEEREQGLRRALVRQGLAAGPPQSP
ncbi:MAG: nitroreductase family protein [Deinococcus sp.]